MFKQLMIQGTTSDAGKSMLCTALCHWLAKHNVTVAPFKPQNMALNSAVTKDGGEIGRAQAVQAQAAGIDCHTDMNPVLLKPNSETGSQIIIQGRAIGNMNAREYHHYKATAKQAVLESYRRLQQQFQCVIIEGAGSPAEINLRHHDIANMGFAEAVDCPVIIVADIHPGGVFAQLYGTLALLSPSEQQRVIGFVINRFRGDKSLLQPGIDWLEQKTSKPVLGVLPWLENLYLDAEDSMAIRTDSNRAGLFNIVIPKLRHLSNHTDFDALFAHPKVNVQFINIEQDISGADLIILPGSKNVMNDCQALLENRWPQKLKQHLRYGGKVMGICGGYQMLGQQINDPHGIESTQTVQAGLALLDFETTLQEKKTLSRTRATLSWCKSPVSGYEIHCGKSTGPALRRPSLRLEDGRIDGVLSEDEQIFGSYLHGIFDEKESCQALLQWAGLKSRSYKSLNEIRHDNFTRLADCLDEHLDMEQLIKLTNRYQQPKEVPPYVFKLDTITK